MDRLHFGSITPASPPKPTGINENMDSHTRGRNFTLPQESQEQRTPPSILRNSDPHAVRETSPTDRIFKHVGFRNSLEVIPQDILPWNLENSQESGESPTPPSTTLSPMLINLSLESDSPPAGLEQDELLRDPLAHLRRPLPQFPPLISPQSSPRLYPRAPPRLSPQSSLQRSSQPSPRPSPQFLTQNLPQSSPQPSPLSSQILSPERPKTIPKIRLLRVVEAVLEDKQCYKAFLEATGQDAQRQLDIIQTLLTNCSDIASTRRSLLMALMRLSTKSGIYPQCLILRSVEHEDQPVAAGQFGEIRRGTFRGQRVCLKVVKLYQRGQIEHLLRNCAKEAIIWSHLEHPNLLPFYGIYHLDDSYGRVCMVSPWMDNGNICDYLKENPTVPRMPLIVGIVKGLNHLHEEHIVHGDLKGVNILVTSTGCPCLADFGLSSVMDADVLRWTTLETMTQSGGTARWIAPELMDDAEEEVLPRPTFASDIYSLASVMYEVLSGQIPFYEYPRDVTVLSKVLKGVRPTRPSPRTAPQLTDSIWGILQHCWAQDPKDRPTIQMIVKQLLARRTASQEWMEGSEHLLSATAFRKFMHGDDGDMVSVDDMEVFVRLLYL